MSFITTFNGLEIEYDVGHYTPAVCYLPNGDPGYPEDGGDCEDWEVLGVEDLDLLFNAIEAQLFEHDPDGDWVTRKAFRVLQWCVQGDRWEQFTDRQRERLTRHFRRFAMKHWDAEITESCTDHYWDEVGGPSGAAEYAYTG